MGDPKKYRCLIVDDEPNAIQVIEHHLLKYSNYEVMNTFTDSISAGLYLKNNPIDILFLDIQMPGINGIELLKSLNNKPCVFLTTAYRHYAPEAFDLEVLDYLLKPVSEIRLRKALLKFEHLKVAVDEDNESGKTIVIRANRTDYTLNYSKILYLEAMGDYVKCHMVDKVLITKEPLKSLCQKLPELKFRQVHRSYIVNVERISEQSSDKLKVGDKVLPISRSYRKDS